MRIKTINFTFTLQSMMLAVLLMMTLTGHAASIKWQSYSNGIFSQAKASHRHILLFGYTPTCPYCARMSKYTFTDDKVIAKINASYVAVKINTAAESSLANRYGMYIVPTVLLLDTDGKVLDSIYGYQDTQELLGKL